MWPQLQSAQLLTFEPRPNGLKAAITWDESPHHVFVFCSTALPSVILGEADSWQVDVLDFVGCVPGALESSQALYMKTCHAADGVSQ